MNAQNLCKLCTAKIYEKSVGFRALIMLLIVMLSLICFVTAESSLNWWGMLWIAPLPIILYSFYERFLLVFITATIIYALSALLILALHYYKTMFPIASLIPSCIGYGFVMAVIVIVNSEIVKRCKTWLTVLFFPSAIVASTYIGSLVSGGRLLSQAAFTQSSFLHLIQVVSITGISGIIFLLNLFPNAIAFILLYRSHKKISIPAITFLVVIFGCVMLYGNCRLNSAQKPPMAHIGLAAHNQKDYAMQTQFSIRHPRLATLEYTNRIKILARHGAKYIMQPEYALITTPKSKQLIINSVKKTARDCRVTVFLPIIGANTKHQAISNYVLIISPKGRIVADYNKHHLVFFNEKKMRPGTTIASIFYKQYKIGVAICHDMDFVNPAKLYGKVGTSLLFVPAADFGVNNDAWWHARIAVMQAVANGYSLARAASFGYLTLTTYNGVILGKKRTKINRDVYLVANVPLGSGGTIYSHFGDWFGLLAVVIALMYLICMLIIHKET